MKNFVIIIAFTLGIGQQSLAQEMGPQDVRQLQESPAGSKLLRFLKWINQEETISAQNINSLISDRLIDEYGFEGLADLNENVRANSGLLTLYDANRTDLFEYKIKLQASEGNQWLDGQVKMESKPPYRIDGFQIDISREPAVNTTPIYTPGKKTKVTKTSRKKASTKKMAAEAQSIAQAYHDMGWFSGVVVLAKDGQPFYQEAFGLADEARQIPNTLETKFRIGSINKDYTAVLVLQQMEKGQLSLDDKLAKFDLGFPSTIANQVSIRQLLNHTSGFGDIFIPTYLDNIRDYKDIDDILPLLRNAPLAYEPGTDQRYSNYGYIVLGAILEKVTGKPFGQLLQENILSVIGADDTHYDIAEKIEGEAQSYRYTLTGKKENYTANLEYPTPDGGMYATADDLLRFFQASFFDNSLISDQSKMLIVNDFEDAKGSWEKVLNNPNDGIGLAGGGPGVSAMADIEWKDRLTIIVLANTDGNIAEEIALRILRVYQGSNYRPVKLPATHFVYQLYQKKGKDFFADQLQKEMKEAGYGKLNPSILNRIGYALLNEKNYEDAIAIFQANIGFFPEEANPYDSLGEAYLKAGEKDRALEYYQKALELDPKLPSALEMVKKLRE